MKAVVFDGLYKVSVQDRPVPQSKLTSHLASDMPVLNESYFDYS